MKSMLPGSGKSATANVIVLPAQDERGTTWLPISVSGDRSIGPRQNVTRGHAVDTGEVTRFGLWPNVSKNLRKHVMIEASPVALQCEQAARHGSKSNSACIFCLE